MKIKILRVWLSFHWIFWTVQDFDRFYRLLDLVFRILSVFSDLDLFGFSDIVSSLTVQILKGFHRVHNLFDKWIALFDFWNFMPVGYPG